MVWLLLSLAHAEAPALRYTTTGVVERLTPTEVAARIAAAPGARHLVWLPGMPAWVPPEVVPEVAAAVAALPVRPEPPWRYTTDGRIVELTTAEVAARLAERPDANHFVWRRGMAAWRPAREVDSIAALVPARPTGPAVAAPTGGEDVIAARLRRLEAAPRTPIEVPELVPSATPGESEGVSFEAPPLPGSEPEMEIEVLTPEEYAALQAGP